MIRRILITLLVIGVLSTVGIAGALRLIDRGAEESTDALEWAQDHLDEARGPDADADATDHGHPAPSPRRLRRLLRSVDVVDRLPDHPGYDRGAYGPEWTDTSDAPDADNGCETRDDVLRDQLTRVRTEPGTKGCNVLSGRLDPDPYTGRTLHLTPDDPSAIQVDHVYPLSRAWDAGAWRWTEARRTTFANDTRFLLAVDGPANMSKGDAGPGEWLPLARGSRCPYAATYLRAARTYNLPITRNDRRAIQDTLTHC